MSGKSYHGRQEVRKYLPENIAAVAWVMEAFARFAWYHQLSSNARGARNNKGE